MKTRLKQRRGAITVMTALIFLSLVTCMAIAIDFSRLWTVRGELQTSADAGALAGAMQFLNGRDTLAIVDTTTSYVRRNRTLGDTIRIDSIQKGNYNGTTRVFTPFPSGALPSNAVNVVVSYLPSRMWMRAFGSTVPRMKARAIAWASAPVATNSGCMKPWAIPYEVLMFAINNYRGIANTNANLTRAFDQNLDMAALQNMTAAQRRFNLKMGDNGNQNQQQQTGTTGATVGSMPGNFQAVVLPKLWDYGTQSYANPAPQPGGQAYRDNIEGTTCTTLSVGDSLMTETGNKVGPTLQAAEPAVCNTIVQNGSNIGDCLNTSGQVGVDIKAAFFNCRTGCQGRTNVEVSLLGSFTLEKIYPRSSNNPPFDKAQIVGVFKPIQGSGPAGGGSTTHQRLVLAK